MLALKSMSSCKDRLHFAPASYDACT